MCLHHFSLKCAHICTFKIVSQWLFLLLRICSNVHNKHARGKVDTSLSLTWFTQGGIAHSDSCLCCVNRGCLLNYYLVFIPISWDGQLQPNSVYFPENNQNCLIQSAVLSVLLPCRLCTGISDCNLIHIRVPSVIHIYPEICTTHWPFSYLEWV